MLDDLREQSFDEDLGGVEEPASGLLGMIGQLAPWQRFALALLIFLNTTLLGCMCLIMAGRVVPFR